MSKRMAVADEGIVELGEFTYRILVNALNRIAAHDGTCCRGYGPLGRHRRTCPVSIAQGAMRDAARASKAFRG